MKKKAKSKVKVLLHTGQTVSEAFAAILKHNHEHLLAWETAARSWDDIEGVHQVRVALRRLRSALRVFRSAIPRAVTDPWADEMRWLANQLGPARDMDVFIDEGMDAVADKLALPGREKLLLLAQGRRVRAYETVLAMLDSERYADFKKRLGAWLETQGWLAVELSDKERGRLEGNIIPFARQVLDKQERAVLATGSHVDQESAQEMHRLRIECKKLRYAAEFFNPLFKTMEEFIAHLKSLQDLLGIMHDVAVMHDLLEDLLKGETDPQVFQYAGGLVGWRTRQYYDIKDNFDARWDEFVDARHPWWAKSAVEEKVKG
ncbi:MAG: CHAD domain-containing protein [Candidatus Competibacteraceae bacterium]